jgi:hypothetical protein
LIDTIVENVSNILKTSKPVENKFNINLFPVSEPHDVGHIDAEKMNSLFPSLHESGAIPKTDFVVDEELENTFRKRDEGLKRKKEIMKNMSKFSASSSESSDESVISMGKNPLYKESALSSQLDDKYNTDHSYYSSNFSTVSGLSHIPGRPHLPHHHLAHQTRIARITRHGGALCASTLSHQLCNNRRTRWRADCIRPGWPSTRLVRARRQHRTAS